MFLKNDERAKTYQPSSITNRQMSALEAFIIKSKDASDFAKRAIIWALRQTESLAKPVALSLWYKDFDTERVDNVQDGAHDMNSSNASTHIHYFFEALETEVGLSENCGCFVPIREEGNSFNTKAAGVTIWFSHIFYDSNALLLKTPSLQELEGIGLSIP